ncbi:MAG: glycosyl hydrolase family 65 protein [Solirubrobacteraceae bacterium]
MHTRADLAREIAEPAPTHRTYMRVRRYARLRRKLSIDSRLPHAWASLSFSLRFRDRQLRIEPAHDEEQYVLEDGALEAAGRPVLNGAVALEQSR